MNQQVHIFGIRHHGPGGANALVSALGKLKPDLILVEGPPEADALLNLAIHPEIKPPVALLLHEEGNPQNACFYPFAVFSPEWQAITLGLTSGVPVRFMDLPVANRLVRGKVEESLVTSARPEDGDETMEGHRLAQVNEDSGNLGGENEAAVEETDTDPFQILAQAAGYSDGERFWEHLVEQRGDHQDIFQAVMEAMVVLRGEKTVAPGKPGLEERREAHMRKVVRLAMKEGFGKIAVVCGAWHAPVLRPETMPPASADNKLLAGLPKVKVVASWIPWTYSRLTFSSGYGAGVESPGWYHHLFRQRQDHRQNPERAVIAWFARIARLLRQKDLDCSSAHIIEATRLAMTLAALRGRALPGLDEIREATLGVLTFGDSAPLALIQEKLHVADRLGQLPSDSPLSPLQEDLRKQQKRLRLRPEPSDEVLELDLRKQNDLERSQLLHRLALLGIPWGDPARGQGAGSRGTFKEIWRTRWKPEFALALIEAGPLGNSIYDATSTKIRLMLGQSQDLAGASAMLDRVFLAGLPEAARWVMRRIETLAAVAADVQLMMRALPPLANILRYGNVRKMEGDALDHVVHSLGTRIIIGLPLSCVSLNDEAANEWGELVGPVHAAFELVDSSSRESGGECLLPAWMETLGRVAGNSTTHGLLAGRMTRLCLDSGHVTPPEAGNRMLLALSRGADPAQGARWIEGFLSGSGLVLLHHHNLWDILDQWLGSLNEDAFFNALPLMRRTFALFTAPERRQMGQRIRAGFGRVSTPVSSEDSREGSRLDEGRAKQVFPILGRILGWKFPAADALAKGSP